MQTHLAKLFFIFGVWAGALWSAPVGNPSSPKIIEKGIFSSCNRWFSCRVGYEGDFVADGRLKQIEQSSGRVDIFRQETNSGTVTAAILDRIDLYGVLGSSKVKANWRFESSDQETVTRITMRTHWNFLWAVGARAILFEWGNASLGTGGRYAYCPYTPLRIKSNGITESPAGAMIHWREWQANLDLSYRITFLIPYIGVKYSNALCHLSGFSTPISSDMTGTDTFQNRIPWGIYLGCTLSNGRYFLVNLEGRLTDEEAITVSADLKF